MSGKTKQFISSWAKGTRLLLLGLGLLVVSLGALLPAALSSAAAVSFSLATNFDAGANPQSVAVGDLNGDGKPDLAVANPNSNTVSILLGTGTGSFGAATNFAAGSLSHSVAIGDLNGDGKPDLATANTGAHTVSVLLNNTATGGSTPSFGAAANFSLGSGFGAFSVAIGDLNSDGKPDLAVANANSGNVSVLLNNTATGGATPSFGAAANFAVGPTARFVAIGDLNGDGKPDLAVVDLQSNTVAILLNNTATGGATPSFGAATTFAAGPSPFSVRYVGIGDLNGDGKPDLAVVNSFDNTVSVFLNSTATGGSTPSFGAATNFAVGGSPHSVAIGDLNGDAKPDLAVANLVSNTVSVLLNDGTGTFGAATKFSVGTSPISVAVGDFNADGKLDLAVANVTSNTVSILLNITPAFNTSPSVTFSRPVPDIFPGSPIRSCIVGIFPGPQNLPLVHHWKILSRGTGRHQIQLEIGAEAVNDNQAGLITATVSDESGAPQSVTVAHPSGAHQINFGPLTLTVLGNKVYDLDIAKTDTGPAQHYRVGAVQRFVEIGWDGFAHYHEGGPDNWAFHARAGEQVKLKISVDPTGSGVPGQTTAVEYAVVSADLSSIPVPRATTPSLDPTHPIAIQFVSPSDSDRTYIFQVRSIGPGGPHHLAEKLSGDDRGLYVLPCGELAADGQVVSVSLVSAPQELQVDQDAAITISKTVKNNGPLSQSNFVLTTTPKAPSNCTVRPSPDNEQLSLSLGKDRVVQETFTVRCSQPSFHPFNFVSIISPANPSTVQDPNPGNNQAGTVVGRPVIALADLQLASFQAPIPTTLFVSQTVFFASTATVKNNGPFGPVDARNGWGVDVPPGMEGSYRVTDPNDRVFIKAGVSYRVIQGVTVVQKGVAQAPQDQPPPPDGVPTQVLEGLVAGDIVKVLGTSIEFPLNNPAGAQGTVPELRAAIFVPGLQVGESRTIQRDVDLHCLEAGPHRLSVGSRIDPVDPHVRDTVQNNGARVEGVVECVILVAVDIKPQSCPNPLNVVNKGVLPVAILGTENFDVSKIDVSTVKLVGVSPLSSALEDVATPFVPFIGKTQATDCTTAGADGLMDLTLKFDHEAVVTALGTVTDGEVRRLRLKGNLKSEFGGARFQGEDVVVIIKMK